MLTDTLRPSQPTSPFPDRRRHGELLDRSGVDAEAGPIVKVRGLEKRYGSTRVLHGVSFAVEEGELFGLLGTNGAGKTTTVEILQGLRRADGGSVEVLGLDPAASGDRLRRRIGAQLQNAALPERMRVGEALKLFASLHPAPRILGELAEEWQLDGLLNRRFAALSGGERQRLFVALALVGQPRLVFLDELTQNLDPVGRRRTWEMVRQIREGGTTVVLVTHDVEEAERLCDRIVVLDRGRVVAEGTPTSIVSALGGRPTVVFTDADLDVHGLAEVPGVEQVRRHGAEVRVTGTGPVLAHVAARLVSLGRPPLDLRVVLPTLEDRFVALTQDPIAVTDTAAAETADNAAVAHTTGMAGTADTAGIGPFSQEASS